VYINTFSQ